MMAPLLKVATAALIALTALAGPATAHESTLPPCVHEDGSGGPVPCVWDGDERGNGTGETYIVRR